MAAKAAAAAVGRMKLGSQGLEVSRQGLGCMGMSALYGPPKPEPDMVALIHHAVASGVTFFDSSDVYGPFTNEVLLGKVRTHLINSVRFIFKEDNPRAKGGDSIGDRRLLEGE